jgi:D-lactate dehydrogenase (cytochrome)
MPAIITDPAQLRAVLADAAGYPGGHAAGLALPASAAEVAALVRGASSVLPVGAQSSLTGGATPRGELVLSLARLDRIEGFVAPDEVRVGAGVPLARLQAWLAERGCFYPPVPAYNGAQVGGTVATNAAGPATFKYGATRPWVQALSVVLASGDALDIRRGQVVAPPGQPFLIDIAGRRATVPAPAYVLPALPKCSAGYHSARPADLIDLFIGSEGTLGVITAATLRVVRPAPLRSTALVFVRSEPQMLALVGALRSAARATWRGAGGLDIAAIEYLDDRSLNLLRDDGHDRRLDVALPPAAAALLVDIELQPDDPCAIERARVALGELLERHGLPRACELSDPADAARAAQLLALRSAVPQSVNARVAAASRDDPGVTKCGADMIVPFDRLGDMLKLFHEGFGGSGLPYAIWGHVSDGNLHPNAIPRSSADVARAQQIILEAGLAVAAMGGSPLAEHGVGRNAVKQALLAQLVGAAGIAEMRAVKAALDPGGKLAPGVLLGNR